MKAQAIRVLDVVVIGPLMIYAGVNAKAISPELKAFLVVAGAGTVIYNGANFLKKRQRRRGRR